MNHPWSSIVRMFHLKGNALYMISEDITQENHALQTYVKMKELGGDAYQQVGALLHDVGHLLEDQPIDPRIGVNDAHEYSGAQWLRENGFDERVWGPVLLHVDAKRYLCGVKSYYSTLSEASKISLRLQGGPMESREQRFFEQSPHFKDAIMLRHCDDQGKDVKLTDLPPFESLQEMVMGCVKKIDE
jgi:predicted HD phosphohydrolase